MGGPKSKASREEILSAFQTEEGFKAVATRVGMSPNTLRVIWKEAFGEEAFTERGKRLQTQAAAKVGHSRAGTTQTYKDILVICTSCGNKVTLKTNQVAQIDLDSFVCEECRCDRKCPVCNLLVDGERGLSGHFRHRREAGDEAHINYKEMQDEARWASVTQNLDYVVCLVCGHRAETLARHLKAAHGITADQYRAKYSSEVQIRSQTTTEAMSEAAKNKTETGKGETKTITCPGCGTTWIGSKFLVSQTHDFRCTSCKKKADEQTEILRWVGKTEPEDYVTCLECGYRAENLNSHLQNAHSDYRKKHPEALVNSLNSAVRDKTAIRGVPRPPEFGQKIREAKLLNLTFKDFEPYLESDGTIDHHKMVEILGYAWPTLKSYMDTIGLKATNKYWKQAKEEHTVRLTTEDLKPFKLKNGKISMALAISGLNYCGHTIKRECRRLGVTWAHGNISQRKCLDAISKVLGDMEFKEEWKAWRFVNPTSGYRFRFDGLYLELGLIVEFMGSFHSQFPNSYMPNESYRPVFEALQERDRIKREMIQNSPDLIYFSVAEEEPYMDLDYLRGRLVEAGILEVRIGGLWIKELDRLVHANADYVPEPISLEDLF